MSSARIPGGFLAVLDPEVWDLAPGFFPGLDADLRLLARVALRAGFLAGLRLAIGDPVDAAGYCRLVLFRMAAAANLTSSGGGSCVALQPDVANYACNSFGESDLRSYLILLAQPLLLCPKFRPDCHFGQIAAGAKVTIRHFSYRTFPAAGHPVRQAYRRRG